MEGIWLISYVVLWVLVVCMGVVILAHSRLLGILHHRFGPAHAKPLADGPAIGTAVTAVEAERFNRTPWTWRFPSDRELLLLFVSPQCQSCDRLIPHVTDFAKADREVAVALLSTLEDPGMNEAFTAYRKLSGMIYVNAVKLADEFEIEGTPYAVWLDRSGIVRAKGLVNHYEHLLSLSLDARQLRQAERGEGEAAQEQVANT